MKRSLAMAKQAQAAVDSAATIAALKAQVDRLEAKIDKLLAGAGVKPEKGKKPAAPAEPAVETDEVGA